MGAVSLETVFMIEVQRPTQGYYKNYLIQSLEMSGEKSLKF